MIRLNLKQLMRKKLKSNKRSFYPVSLFYIIKKNLDSVNRALKNGWTSSVGTEIKKYPDNQKMCTFRI
jgi:hypothetical protein